MPTYHILILVLMEIRQDSISFLFFRNRQMIWGSYKKQKCSRKKKRAKAFLTENNEGIYAMLLI